MIIVTDRKLNIPRSDLVVGFTGDNLMEVRTFELSRTYGDIDLSLFDFKLDTQVGEVKNIIDLAKVVEEETITLTWTIEESHVVNSGRMAIQVRAFHGAAEKWHSSQEYVLVQPSINPASAQPDPLPSEFEQMEVRITLAKNEAQEAEQGALGQANRAQGIADTFSNTTLPEGIIAIQAAGQAKVDLAGVQATIAVNKAKDALDSAAAALVSEQAAKGSEDWAKAYAEDAEGFAGDAEDSAQIAANNILNGVDTHNQNEASHADIRDEIQTVEAIARGKAQAHVFDTYTEMTEWLAIPENIATLEIGDNLYIRDTMVTDYWWDGTGASELEAEAPSLVNYYTKAQVDGMMPITIEREDYDALVVAGTVEAGRIYFIIEGDLA